MASRHEFLSGDSGAVFRLADEEDRPASAQGLVGQQACGIQAPERDTPRPGDMGLLEFIGRAHVEEGDLRIIGNQRPKLLGRNEAKGRRYPCAFGRQRPNGEGVEGDGGA